MCLVNFLYVTAEPAFGSNYYTKLHKESIDVFSIIAFQRIDYAELFDPVEFNR